MSQGEEIKYEVPLPLENFPGPTPQSPRLPNDSVG